MPRIKITKVAAKDGAKLAREFTEHHQNISTCDGPYVLDEEVKENVVSMRAHIEKCKAQLTAPEYTKALEVLLLEHTLDYVLVDTVCDGFLAQGAP